MSEQVEKVRPINCTPCNWDNVDDLVADLKKRYSSAGGESLRSELVSSITGARLTIVFDWEDM